MDELYTEEQVMVDFKAQVTDLRGGTTRFADRVGVSTVFVSRVSAGDAKISEKMLDALGYERVTMFRKKAKATQ